jgi:hypothetical protein
MIYGNAYFPGLTPFAMHLSRCALGLKRGNRATTVLFEVRPLVRGSRLSAKTAIIHHYVTGTHAKRKEA